MWVQVLISAAVVLFAVGLGHHTDRERLRRKRARFSGREVLSFPRIFDLYYASRGFDKQRVAYLWSEIASILQLDAGRLRPTDRFDAELRAVRGFPVEDELADLDVLLKRECQRIGKELPCHPLSTLDEFVRFLAQT